MLIALSFLGTALAAPISVTKSTVETYPVSAHTASLGQVDVGFLSWGGLAGGLQRSSPGIEAGWSGGWITSWLRPRISLGFASMSGQDAELQLFGAAILGSVGIQIRPISFGAFFPAFELSAGPTWIFETSPGGTRNESQTLLPLEIGLSLHYNFRTFEFQAKALRQFSLTGDAWAATKLALGLGFLL